MKKRIKKGFIIIVTLYILLCGFFYFYQDRIIIFRPQKLDKNFVFRFKEDFEEINIKMADGNLLNGLLFKSDSTKGLIFYLHGNAGTLESWGNLAGYYTAMYYDVFMLDYRGFGKSEGSIESQNQLFDDVRIVYDEMKKRYDETSIVIMGYSVGTGIAAKLASENNPKMLILHAPYYNMASVVQYFCPVIPDFLIRYKLETNRYIKDCTMPIVIYHGDSDKTINYQNSIRLKELLKPTDSLILLQGQGHNAITQNSDYLKSIVGVLNNSNR